MTHRGNDNQHRDIELGRFRAADVHAGWMVRERHYWRGELHRGRTVYGLEQDVPTGEARITEADERALDEMMRTIAAQSADE